MGKGVREHLQAAVADNKRINLILLNGGNLKGKAEALTYRMIKIQTEEQSMWVPITEILSVSNTFKPKAPDRETEESYNSKRTQSITISRIKKAIAEEEHPRKLRALAELLITYLDESESQD